ncbi:MAG: exodeoxyribonuclease VII small subunit [Ectothiorhodospiraceae bacterium]|nr:exodeoxyribonuclease VII small subunit [Ectothiorhodospiraceae bacterium]
MAENESEAPDFEQALKELEGLVERLEQGELTLEESLKSFERGIELTRRCQQALQAAEQKVEILTSKDGDARVEPFPAEPESD